MAAGLLSSTLAAGYDHSLAIKSDGGVWGWGDGSDGELGNNTASEVNGTPMQIAGITDARSVAAGDYFSLAVDNSGAVWSWGVNYIGQLGNGSTNDSSTPGAVPGLGQVTAVAAGEDFGLALEANGTVWAWGGNDSGALGPAIPSGVSSDTPIVVAGLSGIRAIAAGGEFALALDSNGTVYAWGDGRYGQLGDGSASSSAIPTAVPGLIGVQSMSAGRSFALASEANGSVWAWGDDGYGQLANGESNGQADAPIQVNGLANAVSVAAGGEHSLATLSDGSVWAWGDNYDGQLGNDSSISTSPVEVAGVSSVTGVAAGYDFSVALEGDGSVWGWGDDFSGQLGTGSTGTEAYTPEESLMTEASQPPSPTGVQACTPALTSLPISAPEVGFPVMAASDARLKAAGVAISRPTVASLPSGGLRFVYRVGSHQETAALPPDGFDATIASQQQLNEYGLPERPSGGAALEQWNALFRNATFATPPSRLLISAPQQSPIPSGACGESPGGVSASTTSSNWTGYIDQGDTNPYTDAGVEYTEPHTVSSTSCGAEYVSIWAGLGGSSAASQGLIQDGTTSSDPADGLSHNVWYEDYPGGSVYPQGLFVRAGDYVDAVVHYDNATGDATYVVKDVS
ncbi:MAG: hypothetical protein JOY80_03330, partial [Candidatus Dormibacteraeota bacterium]|nr:hypothetical protein [Candidatus Dormibacteraeota bacterium]